MRFVVTVATVCAVAAAAQACIHRPRTRSIQEVRHLGGARFHRIDSDAFAFRIDRTDGTSAWLANTGSITMDDERGAVRIVALYFSRREETIHQLAAGWPSPVMDPKPPEDLTTTIGTMDFIDERRTRNGKPVISSLPSFYVHLGVDSPPGLPEFSTADGTVLVPHRVVPLDRDGRMLRIDLDVEDGVVRVRAPGTWMSPDAYAIDLDFVPTTRFVDRSCVCFCLRDIDSDAIALRIERANGDSDVVFNAGYLADRDERDATRLVALYGDGREEPIFEYPPQP